MLGEDLLQIFGREADKGLAAGREDLAVKGGFGSIPFAMKLIFPITLIMSITIP